MRRNKLDLRLLQKLRSNPTYIESLDMFDDSEYYEFQNIERATTTKIYEGTKGDKEENHDKIHHGY